MSCTNFSPQKKKNLHLNINQIESSTLSLKKLLYFFYILINYLQHIPAFDHTFWNFIYNHSKYTLSPLKNTNYMVIFVLWIAYTSTSHSKIFITINNLLRHKSDTLLRYLYKPLRLQRFQNLHIFKTLSKSPQKLQVIKHPRNPDDYDSLS